MEKVANHPFFVHQWNKLQVTPMDDCPSVCVPDMDI